MMMMMMMVVVAAVMLMMKTTMMMLAVVVIMMMMTMMMMMMMMMILKAEKSVCWNRPGRQMKLFRNHKEDQRTRTKQGHCWVTIKGIKEKWVKMF